jgi:glucokinase
MPNFGLPQALWNARRRLHCNRWFMASPEFPYPILLADIGGTNARFSMIKAEGRDPTPVFKLKTDSTATFAEACDKAVSMQGLPRPRSLIVDGAGPVIGKTIDLTNAGWIIDGDELTAALRLDQGLTINDFEALALGLPYFSAQDLDAVGPAPMGSGGTRLVLGPGTGLGVGALAQSPSGGYLPIGSEGGHVTLRPLGAREERIFEAFEAPADPASAEMYLQGAGILRLHQARLKVEDQGPERLAPPDVVEAALAADGPERRTMLLYLDLLARFTGDMAVTFLPKAGVFIAGGIMPRLKPLLDPTRFRALFEAHPPHEGLLAGMGISMVVAEEPAFAGLAAVGTNPAAFLLNYADRLWKP